MARNQSAPPAIYTALPVTIRNVVGSAEFLPDNSSISYGIKRRLSSCWDISSLKWPTLKVPSKVPWNVWKLIAGLNTIGTKEFGGTLD
ncbi:hypothetical protein NW761_003652 [Fusarium oxysporum]|nr:hypothetical protein NW758_001171 [Fusarium oxysporum]KAJ4100666.1 hypothetical protein NW761_003652 [Fusarium oxysporum]